MKTILNQNIILLSKLEISLIKQKINMVFQWRILTCVASQKFSSAKDLLYFVKEIPNINAITETKLTENSVSNTVLR